MGKEAQKDQELRQVMQELHGLKLQNDELQKIYIRKKSVIL